MFKYLFQTYVVSEWLHMLVELLLSKQGTEDMER